MLDALAKLIVANPAEALGLASALVTLIVWGVSRIPHLSVPEASVKRWATQVVVAALTALATEWLAPPFEWQKAVSAFLALLGGSLVIFRAAKWLIANLWANRTS